MIANTQVRQGLSKVVLTALLALFLLPGIGYWFADHALSRLDEHFLATRGGALVNDSDASSPDLARVMEQARQAARKEVPSAACDLADEHGNQRYRVACERYSTVWQFVHARRVSGWLLVAGVVLLVGVLALGALAFANRNMQHRSFVSGSKLLVLASAAEIVLQGALLVWLSFWMTAVFFNVYYPKLIIAVALAVGLAVIYAVVCMLKRAPHHTAVTGMLVADAAAPALWRHVRTLAERADTKPPDNIVAGIDTNFFVTQSPLSIGEQMLHGRSLYLSLPLLRVLDRSEADAVLSHELAHFSGGDTASSAALGPDLVYYDNYCRMMADGGVTFIAYYLLRLYRVIFEFALSSESRAREFLADGVAAKLTSPRAVATALIKVAAFARYRGETERALFNQSDQHNDTLNIAARVAAGLAAYANTPRFLENMRQSDIPHPFDSHPPLIERMRNIGHEIAESGYGAVVALSPAATWVEDMPPAEEIENALWSVYEQRFAAVHEQTLAYRYRPSNDKERELVIKYFPPMEFTLNKGERVGISIDGLMLPEATDVLPWDRVVNFSYTDGPRMDELQISHPEKGLLGSKTTRVLLRGMEPHRQQFKAVLGAYWERHKTASQSHSGG